MTTRNRRQQDKKQQIQMLVYRDDNWKRHPSVSYTELATQTWRLPTGTLPTTGKVGRKIHKQIMTPGVAVVRQEIPDKKMGTFKLPPHYIKYHLSSGSGTLHENDYYDLAEEDVKWLAQRNKKRRTGDLRVSETQLAQLLDLFEKECHRKFRALKESFSNDVLQASPGTYYNKAEACAAAQRILGLHGKMVEDVHFYWSERRKVLKAPLMRCFWDPPAFDDTTAERAFRPRERERRRSTRNPRRTETPGYHKLRILKQDFKQVLRILQLVREREMVKRQLAIQSVAIFDEKLSMTPFGRLYMTASARFGASAASSGLRTSGRVPDGFLGGSSSSSSSSGGGSSGTSGGSAVGGHGSSSALQRAAEQQAADSSSPAAAAAAAAAAADPLGVGVAIPTIRTLTPTDRRFIELLRAQVNAFARSRNERQPEKKLDPRYRDNQPARFGLKTIDEIEHETPPPPHNSKEELYHGPRKMVVMMHPPRPISNAPDSTSLVANAALLESTVESDFDEDAHIASASDDEYDVAGDAGAASAAGAARAAAAAGGDLRAQELHALLARMEQRHHESMNQMPNAKKERKRMRVNEALGRRVRPHLAGSGSGGSDMRAFLMAAQAAARASGGALDARSSDSMPWE